MNARRVRHQLAGFHRQLRTHRGPRGLIGVRTFWPRTDADRVHRQLAASAFSALPKPVALGLQLVLWLRWVGYEGWRVSLGVWRRERQQDGTQPGAKALLTSLWRSLGHGVHPAGISMLGLDSDTSIDRVLAHIHGSEAGPFHRVRSERRGDPSGAAALLADKAATSTRLRDAGIPVVDVIAVWSPDETIVVDDLFSCTDSGVVLKPNTASSSRGIIFLDRDRVPRDLHGRALERSLDALLGELQARGDTVIAQPHVPSHPDFAGVGSSADETLVVRVITTMTDTGPQVAAAWAEIPGDNGRFWIAAIDEAGVLDDPQWPCEDVPPSAGVQVPDWSELVGAVRGAHEAEPLARAHSIAWDVIPGPDGPCVLEGNFGWDLAPFQRLYGPLLDDRDLCRELLGDAGK